MKQKIIITLLTVCVLAGCVSESKRRFRAEEFYHDHPEELANKCAEKFVNRTEYIQGNTVTLYDTLVVKGDSVDCPTMVKYVEKVVKVKCPDSKIITLTNVRVDTFRVENTAKVEALQLANKRIDAEASKFKAQLNAVETQSKNRLKLLLLFIIICLGLLYRAIKS